MPGVQESDVVGMEDVLTDPGSEVRSRKEAMRDVLRRATTVVVSYVRSTACVCFLIVDPYTSHGFCSEMLSADGPASWWSLVFVD